MAYRENIACNLILCSHANLTSKSPLVEPCAAKSTGLSLQTWCHDPVAVMGKHPGSRTNYMAVQNT